MALHLADQIVAWVVTQLDGLTTTTDNVFRGRAQEIAESDIPSISIYMGPDEPVEDLNQFQDMQLTVVLELRAKEDSATIESKLAQIRKEIHVKLRAEFASKLPEVQDYREVGAERPEIDPGSNNATSVMTVLWTFDYRRSYDDPSV